MDEHGKLILIGKTFSQSSNVSLVIKKIEALQERQKIWKYFVLHAHNLSGANEYTRQMRQLSGFEPLAVVDISPVIGMNAGVGATALSIMLS